MIIQCPACHATAELPESKEGAKVRCGACSHVYVARERSRKKRARGSPAPWIAAGAGAVGLLLVVFIANRGGGAAGLPVVEEPVLAAEPAAAVDSTGWESEPVRAARQIHDLVYEREDVRLLRLLEFERLHDAERTEPAEDGGAGDGAAWADLDGEAQADYRADRVARLVAGEDERDALVAHWKPFDGQVLETDDDGVVTVRLQVQPRDPDDGVEARFVDWRMVRAEDKWLPFHWERWISPAEEKAARVAHAKLTTRRTLSDGSVVIEAEVKPLGHLPDTPPELRKRIDELYATMIDLSISPKLADRAREEIIAIGRPAVPILLTGFYEIPLETEEQAIQVNIIVQALRDITGQYFGYQPQVREGSGTGTSAERRDSALKQWFGWWVRKGERFTAKEEQPDLYEQTVIPTQEERRLLERYERQEKSKKKP
jgi:predicted Zn finger-like uncharacterized protein